MALSVVILAAGEGTRMRSSLPKVLHPVGGAPMLQHVIATAQALGPRSICIVYGHGGDRVREHFAAAPVLWVEQSPPLGTGHALAQALPHLAPEDRVLVLYGDVPLIRAATLRDLLEAEGGAGLTLLTAELDDPTGYGRVLRDAAGKLIGVVEERDATEQQRALREVNTGIMAAPGAKLDAWLSRVGNRNAKGEYYLTDVVAMAVDEGFPAHAVRAECPAETAGINDRIQLAAAERWYQRAQAEQLMGGGVTLADPGRIDVRGTVMVGADVSIDVDVVLEGDVRLGHRVRIGPYVWLRDVTVGDDAQILSHCSIEGAAIGEGCRIGPFARLRPGTDLAPGVHVGNFVEVKQSSIGASSKVNHLSYIGDTEMGSRVNVGAGTITCNYDGAHKHRTVIGDDVFIGSDTQFIAPVTVGTGATIGAGSTITRDAPPGELTVSRAPQKTRPGWRRPVKGGSQR